MLVFPSKHIVSRETQNNEIGFIEFDLYFSSIDDKPELQKSWSLTDITKSVDGGYGGIPHDITEQWNEKDGRSLGSEIQF